MAPRPPLTKRQAEVLAALTAYTERHGIAPALRELGAALVPPVRAIATVWSHLEHLREKGYIQRRAGCSRASVVVDADRDRLIDAFNAGWRAGVAGNNIGDSRAHYLEASK